MTYDPYLSHPNGAGSRWLGLGLIAVLAWIVLFCRRLPLFSAWQ